MIITIEEAKTKWCPMVRYTKAGDLYDNRPGNERAGPYCIADQCMAWHVFATNKDVGKEVGYCGLAP